MLLYQFSEGKNNNNYENNYAYLYHIPPKKNRYICLDTETTGLKSYDELTEVGLFEIIDGKMTMNNLSYTSKRIIIIETGFKIIEDKSIYIEQKTLMQKILNFIGDSLIFAHNANFHCQAFNKELTFLGLPNIPEKQFRCSLRIFRLIINEIEQNFNKKDVSLINCFNYFEPKNKDLTSFPKSISDSYMVGKILEHIYSLIDKNAIYFQNYDFNSCDLESNYKIYNLRKKTNDNIKRIQRKKSD
jgi:DNA polymerase III epsilon subunit-like protein